MARPATAVPWWWPVAPRDQFWRLIFEGWQRWLGSWLRQLASAVGFGLVVAVVVSNAVAVGARATLLLGKQAAPLDKRHATDRLQQHADQGNEKRATRVFSVCACA